MTWTTFTRPEGLPFSTASNPGLVGFAMDGRIEEWAGNGQGFRWVAMFPRFYPDQILPWYMGWQSTTNNRPQDVAVPLESPALITDGLGFYSSLQASSKHGAIGTATAGTEISLTDNYSESIVSPGIVEDPDNPARAQIWLDAPITFIHNNYVKLTGIGGMTQLNGTTHQVITSNRTAGWIKINHDIRGYPAWTSGGTATQDLNHTVGQRLQINRDDRNTATSRVVSSVTGDTTMNWTGGPVSPAPGAGTLYDVGRHDGYHIDGFDLLGPTASFPFWNRSFTDIDGAGFTGKNLKSQVDGATGGMTSWPARPFEFRMMLLKSGEIQDPQGNFSKDSLTAQWQPLIQWPGDYWQTGHYGVWDLYFSIDGGPLVLVARNYIRSDLASLDSDMPFHFWQEITSPGATVLTDQPTLVSFRNMRVFDGTNWHAVPRWKIVTDTSFEEDEHGVHMGDYLSGHTVGESLMYATGHARDLAIAKRDGSLNHNFLVGFKYNRTNDLTPGSYIPLSYYTTVEEQTWSQSGGVQYTGPSWDYILAVRVTQDKDRGFFVLRPSDDRRAIVTYPVKEDGTYTFSGDFAHWNAAPPNGQGELVEIYVNNETTPRWTDTIGPKAAEYAGGIPVPGWWEDPFRAINVPGEDGLATFDVSGLELVSGDEVHFASVRRNSTGAFNETALRFRDIAWTPPESVGSAVTLQGLDPRHEWVGRDILIGWAEPDFSAEYQEDEPAGIVDGLDPLVRSFSIDVLDPDTGVVMREVRGLTQRTFRYTWDMNNDDNRAVFQRRAQRDIGFRVWMESVTSRESAVSQITVINEAPVKPGAISLTSSVGDASKGVKATVHVNVIPGSANEDPDFVSFAAWVSETPGFTPSPTNFAGVSARGSINFSFPAPSGVPVYVRVGSVDEFHGDPSAIQNPIAIIDMLDEEMVMTFDAASLPIDTDGIAANAITDFEVISRTGLGEEALPPIDTRGGKLSLLLAVQGTITNNTDEFDVTGRVLRRFSPVSVLYFDGTNLTDYTATAAVNNGTNDVPCPRFVNGDDILYLGGAFPWGNSTKRIDVTFSGTPGDSSSAFSFEYSTGTNQWSLASFVDTTDGLNSNVGSTYWQFSTALPNDWAPVVLGSFGPYYWIRIQQTGGDQGSPFAVDLLQTEQVVATASHHYSVNNDTRQHAKTLVDVATIKGTNPVEYLFLDNVTMNAPASAGPGDLGTIKSVVLVNVGKDRFE